MPGRNRWVLSLLVAVVVAGVVVAVVLSAGGDDCERWQDRYRAAYESMGIEPGMTGSLQFVNMGPLAGLEESRPDGCPTPG